MTERIRNSTNSTTTQQGYQFSNSHKMENELSPRKTLLVLVIVVGCFAVLWPKVFYPMLMGSVNQHIKPSPIDKMTGCCDVISETDINTIKIMNELCGTIIKTKEETTQKPLNNREIVQTCRQEILETCGIDISAVLQEHVRLGRNTKQILDEIRSLNGSLCLKYNYGIAPWRLGVPHRVTVKNDNYIRQERPHHLRSELIHPAFRERGRAIPQTSKIPSSPTRPPPRIVEGRPGPIPGMRPTIGGAGHVVPPSKQGTSSMSVIMPIYTIGIVIFFTYTLMKIIFKKQPEGAGGGLYPPIEPDPHFRKEVFESDRARVQSRVSNGRESKSSKLGDAELDQLRQRLRETELAMERIVEQMAKVPLKSQDLANGTLSNGNAHKPHDTTTDDQPTVKVLGMEMRASCEGGKKWSRPDSPILPTAPTPQPPSEPVPPPQEIYLEGALPAQSHLLVADSATEPQPSTGGEDPAVVLAGKMTLSVISLDSSENGGSNKSDEERQKLCEEIDEEIKELEKKEIKAEVQSEVEAEQFEIVQNPKLESAAEEPPRDLELIETEIEVSQQNQSEPITEEIGSKTVDTTKAETVTEPNLEIQTEESVKEAEIVEAIKPEIQPEETVQHIDVKSESQGQSKIESESVSEPDTKSEAQMETEATARENTVLATESVKPQISEKTETEEQNIDKTESLQATNIEQKEDEEEVVEIEVEEVEKEVDDVIKKAVEQVKMLEEIKTTAEIEDFVEKNSPVSSEVGSNEEVEIEEIVYTSNDEEEEEEEEEDEEEEDEPEALPENSRDTDRTEPDEPKRVNGHGGGTEESKHTTTTSHTVAENDISEGTDNEEVEDEEEEIIEIIDDDEDEEVEEEEEVEEGEGDINVNHIAGEPPEDE